MSLMIELGDQVSVIDLYEKLETIDPQAELIFGDTIKQLRSGFCREGSALMQSLKIPERGYASSSLQAGSFGFTNIVGEVRELKLRCNGGFANISYQQNFEYNIPEDWESCHLQLIGTPDTSATLYQTKAACE